MSKPAGPRQIVGDVLTPAMERSIWSASYRPVLPVDINGFDLQEILPSIFFLLRWGHRRGRGRFLDAFAPSDAATVAQRRRQTTATRIARVLADRDDLTGFEDPAGRAVLADLLLCFCVQNARRALGRNKQVQRVAPTHYFASWIDLPDRVNNLRSVPEMVAATLANQDGPYVQSAGNDKRRTRFPVGDPGSNPILEKFGVGVVWPEDLLADRAGDRFDESYAALGLDQLLTVRLAQQLERAPYALKGRGAPIRNRRPLGARAAGQFSEDLRRFARSYAEAMPRQVFVDCLEACLAIGLTTILTSTARLLLHWLATGEVKPRADQTPAPLLVDCAQGLDPQIRSRAEDAMDDFTRRLWRVPEILMTLRLLDFRVRRNRRMRKQVRKDAQRPNAADWIRRLERSCRDSRRLGAPGPDASDWIRFLGTVLHQTRDGAESVHERFEEDTERLAGRLEPDHPEAAEILRDEARQPNAVRRMASALTPLMGPKSTTGGLQQFLDSGAGLGGPNALLQKRKTERGTETLAGVRRARRDVRRLVFTDAVLEYLVHRHLLTLRGGQRSFSFLNFLREIRRRYGFHVDKAPEDLQVSNEILQRNRAFLERRLRDLGLLRGVNDAESMKRLRPRFALGDIE